MARRRYDTVELVTQLKRERRNGIVLALVGVGILLILLIVYVTAIGGDEVPEVPEGKAAAVVAEEAGAKSGTDTPTAEAAPKDEAGPDEKEASDADEPSPAEDTAKDEQPAEKSGPAKVRLAVHRKAAVWVDGKRVRGRELELDPGEHQFKVKMGRRAMSHTLTTAAATSYEIRFDIRRRRAKVTEVATE